MTFQLIPSLDLLGGRVVRLREGDFASATFYDEALSLAKMWPRGLRLHVVDLEGSRSGSPREIELVRYLVRQGFSIQVGGGVRSVADVETWLATGAERVVIGTLACDQPELFRSIVGASGVERILPAVDLRDGEIRSSGWTARGREPLDETLRLLEESGCSEVLVTDVRCDGKLAGPSFTLYRELARRTSLQIIASGGVATRRDVDLLSRLPGLSGAVVGRAVLEGHINASYRPASSLPPRIVPCLDVRDGRVAKGVRFEQLRDAGDPAELAQRYESEGADEIVLLDIVATPDERQTAIDTVRRVSKLLSIPLTVGGGVRSIADFRALLRAGADRVAINSAAVRRPALIREAAAEFGVQAVVLACDVRGGADGEVVVSGGRSGTGLDPLQWCREAVDAGAGEILLSSVDRDGTQLGFDIALLRRISSAVNAGVIASGGAGNARHFLQAIEEGGACAALAASLFHERTLSIGQVKTYLTEVGMRVRGMDNER
jgi:cyclase